MKRHIKRINAPKNWKIQRKDNTFVRRPNPGAHSLMLGTSMMTLFKELRPMAKTSKEVRNILHEKEVLVNGKRISNPDFIAGFMDIISIPSIDKHIIFTLDEKGFLKLEDLDKKNAKHKMAKLLKKSFIKGKTQLNFLGGLNILEEKKEFHKIGDTYIINIEDKKIVKKIPLEKGANVIVYAGKNIGIRAKLVELKGSTAALEKEGKTFETRKKYLFAVE